MKNKDLWLQRKLDHINNFLNSSNGPGTSGFEDIYLPHQALPGLCWNEITTETTLFGKKLTMPLIINALTGGPPETYSINKKLAEIAKEKKIGIAVGSQSIALKNKELRESFLVVRKKNPTGLVIANLSANVSPKMALSAVEMLEADALQIHLNPAQELFMQEGDRDFKNILENIAQIIEICPVDVIVKEVGFGISKETTKKLLSVGAKWIDVGGSGGTNFIEIETKRWGRKNYEPPLIWGIPTVISILEVKSQSKDINIIASGGIRNALDALKCFTLGAKAVAIAGPFLLLVIKKGKKEALDYFDYLHNDFKKLMLLSGAKNITELNTNVEVIITGKTREWQIQRNL